jgi:hypothetical protein
MDPEKLQATLDRLTNMMHDPWASDEDIEKTFLELMAEDLLNVGNEHYHQRGRGTLIFDLRGKLGWRTGTIPTLYYLTYPDLVEAGNPSTVAKEEIDAYNPQNEVPVIFIYDYGGSGHVISKEWDMRAPK